MLHPGYLMELSERNPEGALAFLQILRELVGGRYFEKFSLRNMPPEEFFDLVLHPQHLDILFFPLPQAGSPEDDIDLPPTRTELLHS